MKKGMCITYEVEKGLYINVTNRCTNNCSFCIRHNGDGAYGSDSLWLSREPSVEEIISDIDKRDMTKYNEVVFCGYGEPSYRLKEVREVALYVKNKFPSLPVRINTNGHSDLIFGCDTSPLYKDAFDVVSVSLNAPTPERYDEMCHPVHHFEAFYALLEFCKNVNNCVQKVYLSVVRESLSDVELIACRRIADNLGVTLKVRTYIGPEG